MQEDFLHVPWLHDRVVPHDVLGAVVAQRLPPVPTWPAWSNDTARAMLDRDPEASRGQPREASGSRSHIARVVLFDTDEASRPASRGLGVAVAHRPRGIIRYG